MPRLRPVLWIFAALAAAAAIAAVHPAPPPPADDAALEPPLEFHLAADPPRCSGGMCRPPRLEDSVKTTASPGSLVPLAHPLDAAGTGSRPLARATFALG